MVSRNFQLVGSCSDITEAPWQHRRLSAERWLDGFSSSPQVFFHSIDLLTKSVMKGKFFFMFVIYCELEMMSLPTQRPKANKDTPGSADHRWSSGWSSQLIPEKNRLLLHILQKVWKGSLCRSASPTPSSSDFICLVHYFSILFQYRVSPRITAASLCNKQTGLQSRVLSFSSWLCCCLKYSAVLTQHIPDIYRSY